MRHFARLLAALVFLSAPALASQNSLVSGTFPTTSPYPGLTLVQNINSAMQAVNSSNSGSSAPSTRCKGRCLPTPAAVSWSFIAV